MFKPF